MSRLDDLTYALASAGYPPERIASVEQGVINIAIGSALNVERVASDVLSAFRVMQSFSDDMEYILKAAPVARVSVTEMAEAMRNIIAVFTEPPPQHAAPKTLTERVPYYDRDKQRWWE